MPINYGVLPKYEDKSFRFVPPPAQNLSAFVPRASGYSGGGVRAAYLKSNPVSPVSRLRPGVGTGETYYTPEELISANAPAFDPQQQTTSLRPSQLIRQFGGDMRNYRFAQAGVGSAATLRNPWLQVRQRMNAASPSQSAFDAYYRIGGPNGNTLTRQPTFSGVDAQGNVGYGAFYRDARSGRIERTADMQRPQPIYQPTYRQTMVPTMRPTAPQRRVL